MGLGEEEGDAKVGQGRFGHVAGAGEVEPQRLERIGPAGLAACRAVAVFGHRHVAGSNHQRDRGRNIERMLPVAAGAADVDCAFGCSDPLHPGAHGQDCPGDLGRSFAAVGQFNQDFADWVVAQLAIEHAPEQRLRLGQRQAHASSLTGIPQIRRKFASIAWPCSVAMLSGWN